MNVPVVDLDHASVVLLAWRIPDLEHDLSWFGWFLDLGVGQGVLTFSGTAILAAVAASVRKLRGDRSRLIDCCHGGIECDKISLVL